MNTNINTGTMTHDSRYVSYHDVTMTHIYEALPIGREGFLTSAASDDHRGSTKDHSRRETLFFS